MDKTSQASKSISGPKNSNSSSTSSNKHTKAAVNKAGGGGGGGGGKKPIKVVYISNPMRVETSAAGFRALVQELTGRHADPSKYTDVKDESAVTAAHCSPAGPAQLIPGAAAAAHAPATAAEYDDDSFAQPLLDNSYAVFSPPTFLYDPHNEV